MRWFFSILAGLLIGGVLHIVSLLAVPVVAPHDAYSRLKELGPANTMIALDAGQGADRLPFLDPGFVHIACRFDLTGGPLRIAVPLAGDYVSASFHGRDAVAFFSLNDRSALGRTLDVELRDADAATKTTPVPARTIVVTSPDETGFVLARAFAPVASLRGVIREELKKAVCEPAG